MSELENSTGSENGETQGVNSEVVAEQPVQAEASAQNTSTVPEVYADFVFPENMEISKSAIECFKPIAKDMGLNQEQAQGLVDKFLADIFPKMVQDNTAKFESTIAEWLETAKSDPEYGGPKYQESCDIAQRAFNSFAGPEMHRFVEESGLAKHPEFIRFCYRVGKVMSEDKMVSGNHDNSGPKTEGERMFPTMKQ